MKELVPKRRFAGFSGEWEERKLGEFGTVAMNKRIFRDQTTETGEIPFYKIGTFGGEADSFIPRKLFEEYKAKYQYPEVGDILLSASGSIGKTVEYVGREEYFQDSNIVWLKHDGRLNNSFLKQFYLIVKWEGLEGSTIKRLYNKNILATNVVFPNSEEQEKIGNFFSKLDCLISLNQQKLDKLKATKSAYLSEMFPQEGELYPKRRFPGFTEPWEKRKLGLESDVKKGTQINLEYLDPNGAYYVLNGGRKPSGYTQNWNTKENTISISEGGESCGFVNLNEEKFWSGGHLYTINKLNDNINVFYLYNYLKSIERKIMGLRVGSGLPNIQIDAIKNIGLILPTLPEQTKIGNFFSNLDSLISAQENKLEKLKALKQAYLTEMFV